MKDEFPTKKDISYLPNKEEFFTSQDKLVKELKDLREEVTVSTHQVTRISDKVEKLEKAVFSN